MYMNKEYNQALKKIREMKRKVSVKEWNKIAKEENLLSTESLKYVSKKSFKNLVEQVRKEANK